MSRRLHIRLRPAAETQVRKGHPWVYSDSIRDQNREATAGELAVIFDRNNAFLAVGFYDPESPIRVRILHHGKPLTIDKEWWRQNLLRAIQIRSQMFDSQTTGYRLIHGENDHWPGLVLDRYGDVLVLKIYSTGWFPRLPEITGLIVEELKPKHLLLRYSRNVKVPAGFEQGFALHGERITTTEFLETGIRFKAEVALGQKTGFFLDQRENRREVETLSRGRKVLNGFSFSGGFSLYAARGGARSVTDLDISAHALQSSRENFELNKGASIQNSEHVAIQADVFQWLESHTDPKFDLVILDPPSLARRETERAGAIKAYEKLNFAGIRLLRPSGILLAASCSAHVSGDEFYGAVLKAAKHSGRNFKELNRTGHPPDHPAIFPEAFYLKAIYLRF